MWSSWSISSPELTKWWNVLWLKLHLVLTIIIHCCNSPSLGPVVVSLILKIQRWAEVEAGELGEGTHPPGLFSHLSLTLRKLFLLPVPHFHHLRRMGWWPCQHMVGGMSSCLLAPWNSWNEKRRRQRNSRASGGACDHRNEQSRWLVDGTQGPFWIWRKLWAVPGTPTLLCGNRAQLD